MPIVFNSVSPIGDTNVNALHINNLDTALDFYTGVLGFTVVSRQEKSATLKRDSTAIGLEANDADPDQASVYFGVSDVEALRNELNEKGTDVSPLRVDEHDGRKYRVFFAREPFGVCFCFGQPA